jgi:hypothetical protein
MVKQVMPVNGLSFVSVTRVQIIGVSAAFLRDAVRFLTGPSLANFKAGPMRCDANSSLIDMASASSCSEVYHLTSSTTGPHILPRQPLDLPFYIAGLPKKLED